MNRRSAGPHRLGKEAIRALAERLTREFAPYSVYLFGSHAYGDPGPNSDIDVMVVLGAANESLGRLCRRGYAALTDLHLPIELHFCSRERFEQCRHIAGSFEYEIATRGNRIDGNS